METERLYDKLDRAEAKIAHLECEKEKLLARLAMLTNKLTNDIPEATEWRPLPKFPPDNSHHFQL